MARMPTEDELPKSLHALAQRNALEVSNTRFGADVERLVSTVRKALGEAGVPTSDAARQEYLRES